MGEMSTTAPNSEPESANDQPVKAKRAPRKPRNLKKHVVSNPIEAEEYFGQQRNKTADLPDPNPSLTAIATGVIDVITGSRQVDQLSRLLSDEVYQRLAQKSALARQQRALLGKKAMIQRFSIQNVHNSSPRDGVIESVVLLNSSSRTRAVTIRLEGINSRWRATQVSVL